jgi:hypothetical protein
MTLNIHDFKPVELEDKPLFDRHYQKFLPVHSDYLFTTMISWKEYVNYHYTFYDDNLIIMTKIRNRTQFRPPVGNPSTELDRQVLLLAQQEGSTPPLGMITSSAKERLLTRFPSLKFFPAREYYDYIYLTHELADLSGSKYRKIRNRLNKFIRTYKYTAERISSDNISEVREFLKRWCLWKDCESDPLLENEKKAILYSMSHFFNLDLSGIAIRVEGEIQAIAVYEGMNPDTAVIHYEKGSPDYKGIYKAVNYETARLIKDEYKFVNREADMGVPGLRRAKLSYRPHHMIEIYSLDRQHMVF